jgi:predicted transposase YdaD
MWSILLLNAVIRQAIDELIVLYKRDEVALAQQITWMKLILERTETIPVSEKRHIQEELHMFDRLVDESPWLKELRNRSEELGREEGRRKGLVEGRAEGRTEGELRNARRMVMDIVEARFAWLVDNAQLRVEHTNSIEELRSIGKQLVVAPDEVTAIRILNTLTT